MTHGNFKTLRRATASTLAALTLAAAFPQLSLADTSAAGLWKVDAAKSTVKSGSVTLTVDHINGTNAGGATGSVIVISKGKVYLVTDSTALNGSGFKTVDYARMPESKAVLIGENARRADYCSLRCIQGAQEPHMTLTFRVAKSKEEQINDMLAFSGSRFNE